MVAPDVLIYRFLPSASAETGHPFRAVWDVGISIFSSFLLLFFFSSSSFRCLLLLLFFFFFSSSSSSSLLLLLLLLFFFLFFSLLRGRQASQHRHRSDCQGVQTCDAKGGFASEDYDLPLTSESALMAAWLRSAHLCSSDVRRRALASTAALSAEL